MSSTEKYLTISDLITDSDIESWKQDDVVTITAGTGKGKSHFIKNKLYNYVKKLDKKVLFLVHRSNCYYQFKHELLKENKNDNISIKTYQSVEWNKSSLNEYDYIIADESHYFLSDATFNNTTEISFDSIMDSKAIKIFMSATSNNINNFIRNEMKINTIDYEMELNYDFIKDIHMFRDDESIHEHIKEIVKKGEKAIIFIQSASKALHIHNTYKDISLFNCSRSNFLYKYVDKQAIDNMLMNERFESQLLISTTVLDAGVNIIDENVKHVILDIKDIDSLIQCMGRKRLERNERVSIYIKHMSNSEISGRIRRLEVNSEKVNYLINYGSKQYIDKFGRCYDGSNVVYVRNVGEDENGAHMEINKLMYHKQLNDIEEFNAIKDMGYKDYIGHTLDYANIIITEDLIKRREIDLYLSTLINEELHLSKDKQCLSEVLNFRNINNRPLRSLNMINSHLKKYGSKYILRKVSRNVMTESGSMKRSNAVWIIDEA